MLGPRTRQYLECCAARLRLRGVQPACLPASEGPWLSTAVSAGAATAPLPQELARRGVVDTQRIAVGGHSYGAFMAANLLAHAPELFACGIARWVGAAGRGEGGRPALPLVAFPRLPLHSTLLVCMLSCLPALWLAC